MCSVPLGFTTSNSSLNLALYVKEGSIPFFYELDSVSNVLGLTTCWGGMAVKEERQERFQRQKKPASLGCPDMILQGRYTQGSLYYSTAG